MEAIHRILTIRMKLKRRVGRAHSSLNRPTRLILRTPMKTSLIRNTATEVMRKSKYSEPKEDITKHAQQNTNSRFDSLLAARCNKISNDIKNLQKSQAQVCPRLMSAGLTGAQVIPLMTLTDFDIVKAYDGALYLARKQQVTFHEAKVNIW